MKDKTGIPLHVYRKDKKRLQQEIDFLIGRVNREGLWKGSWNGIHVTTRLQNLQKLLAKTTRRLGKVSDLVDDASSKPSRREVEALTLRGMIADVKAEKCRRWKTSRTPQECDRQVTLMTDRLGRLGRCGDPAVRFERRTAGLPQETKDLLEFLVPPDKKGFDVPLNMNAILELVKEGNRKGTSHRILLESLFRRIVQKTKTPCTSSRAKAYLILEEICRSSNAAPELVSRALKTVGVKSKGHPCVDPLSLSLQMAAALSPKCPGKALGNRMLSHNDAVAEAIATNPNTPKEALSKLLLRGVDDPLSQRALKNPNAPLEAQIAWMEATRRIGEDYRKMKVMRDGI